MVNGLRLNLLMAQTVLFPQSEISDNKLASMVEREVGDGARLFKFARGL